MRVLIIEDEVKTGRELQRLLENTAADMDVLDILPTVKRSIKWLQENDAPDLIVSDIQLADGICFDIFSGVQVNSPIIFCTAFDEYAIRAFETNGIDYILKPVDEARLKQAVDKYLKIKAHVAPETPGFSDKINALLATMDRPTKSVLLVYEGDKIIPVNLRDISFIYLSPDGLKIYSDSGAVYRMNGTLDDTEKQLDSNMFFRANRQFIIGRKAIKEAEHYFNRRLLVKLSRETPEHVVISKIRTGDFLKWWENS
ncbi:MAG: response regulator transcription factor [Taibaiella sp.]|nr:response regulator transcription factor [Taibaiella sp.]